MKYKHKCPICKKEFVVPENIRREKAKFFPFCSERCQMVDLGAWLDSEYKVTSKVSDYQDQ